MRVVPAAGLVAGFLADVVLGDPRRWHPVAGIGRLAAAVERRVYRDDRASGALHLAAVVGVPAAVVAAADRSVRQVPGGRAVLTAIVTWAALGGTSLSREAAALAESLDAGDVAAARRRLPALCGRDPATLDVADLARATVESVAENTSDAVVAPLLWGALGGPVGIAVYRTVNTLDAMVGYRTRRYTRFGWAAARLDDLLNWLPARLTAALATSGAGVVGGRARDARAAWRRDAAGHPSPNAGPVEAAFAGALGVRLGGGENRYGDHVDVRPALGDGPPPTARDVARAVRLSRTVGVAALALCALAPRRPVRRAGG